VALDAGVGRPVVGGITGGHGCGQHTDRAPHARHRRRRGRVCRGGRACRAHPCRRASPRRRDRLGRQYRSAPLRASHRRVRTRNLMEQLTGPTLPPRLSRLTDLAYDLWWTWNPLAREVFRHLDHALWRQTAHNPVLMLSLLPPEALERAAGDRHWLEEYDRAIAALDAARHDADTEWTRRMGAEATRAI